MNAYDIAPAALPDSAKASAASWSSMHPPHEMTSAELVLVSLVRLFARRPMVMLLTRLVTDANTLEVSLFRKRAMPRPDSSSLTE